MPSNPQDQLRQSEPFDVRSDYVRDRNALAVSADFEPLFVDYYLHLMAYGIRPDPDNVRLLKDTLAALTLHLATRPREEGTAWTINHHDPPLNLFATGESISGNITGRIFTENIRSGTSDLFYSQVSRPGHETRQSMVKVKDTSDSLRTVEHFYDQSEQLPARFFRPEGDTYLLVAGMPDCDEDWLAALDPVEGPSLVKKEALDHMETRPYQFGCGCTIDRILPAIESVARSDIDSLFEGDDHLSVTCPRCAARYQVGRGDFDSWLDKG